MLVATSFGAMGPCSSLSSRSRWPRLRRGCPVKRLHGRKPLWVESSEKGQVVDQFVDLIDLRADHQQDSGAWAARAAATSAHDEPRLRREWPRCPAARLPTTSAKPAFTLQTSDQLQQPVRCGGSRIGVGHNPQGIVAERSRQGNMFHGRCCRRSPTKTKGSFRRELPASR